ncbi:uncharacterized protein TNCV_1864441 [Trichonephila clavipes]|nr:uncharacterized protein TNCV_1864441 [Trichonephila clavipes]
MSNISKYPGHLPDFACYDGNPRNQGLVGVDGACVNKTLHMAPEEEVYAGEVSYKRDFGDEPRNFEPWSSDEDDT